MSKNLETFHVFETLAEQPSTKIYSLQESSKILFYEGRSAQEIHWFDFGSKKSEVIRS